MQPNRLIDGEQLMKALRPERANTQPQIDFREGSNGNGHGKAILNSIAVENPMQDSAS
jgi:hypothetical protein